MMYYACSHEVRMMYVYVYDAWMDDWTDGCGTDVTSSQQVCTVWEEGRSTKRFLPSAEGDPHVVVQRVTK